MKKQKLSLEALKVQSLITDITPLNNEAETIKGGAEVPRTTICTVTNVLLCHTLNCDIVVKRD